MKKLSLLIASSLISLSSSWAQADSSVNKPESLCPQGVTVIEGAYAEFSTTVPFTQYRGIQTEDGESIRVHFGYSPHLAEVGDTISVEGCYQEVGGNIGTIFMGLKVSQELTGKLDHLISVTGPGGYVLRMTNFLGQVTRVINVNVDSIDPEPHVGAEHHVILSGSYQKGFWWDEVGGLYRDYLFLKVEEVVGTAFPLGGVIVVQ